MRSILRGVVPGYFCRLSANAYLVSSLFIATLLVAQPQRDRSETYDVCPNCTYTTPDDAVNNAGVVDGDTIDVQTGTYVLVNTIQVSNSITILANHSVFDADDGRAIDVTGGSTNLSLTNVTIRNGLADTSGGGALQISGGGTVTIVNGTFEDNRADYGGAIHNIGSTVQINVAVFTGNRATFGDGGAVLTDSGGSTTLERTSVDGNQASVAGGGLAVTGVGSSLDVIGSTVSNNVALSPAQTESNLVKSGTTIGCFGNTGQTFKADALALSAFELKVRLHGGGIPSELNIVGRVREGGPSGAVIATAIAVAPGGVWPELSDQTLVYNLDQPVALIPGNTYALETTVEGGYSIYVSSYSADPLLIVDEYVDGGYYCDGPVSGNLDYTFNTFGGAPGDGGGIYASESGIADLVNTTVSGNVGDGATAGSDSTSAVTTLFSTITNNSGNGLTSQDGDAYGLVELTASIVAGNGGYDCDGNNIISGGYNLIGDISVCDISPLVTDQLGVDPLLGPLQENTGWTPTHAIDETSPAFDSAGLDGALPCSDASVDQRDVTRPNGIACDVGAFEFVSPVGPLQTLINAAASGATIIVDPGTYSESITIGSGKTLRGSGPGATVIDVTSLGASAITATGDFTLEGIRVTGGNAAGNGGGILASVSGTDIILSNVQFDNNNAGDSGGAIYLFEGTLTASDITFSNNTAVEEGGAIYARLSDAVVVNGLFDSNSGGNGGAIMLIAGTSSISASEFSLNQATGSDGPAMGGAIYNAADLSITDTSINMSVAEIGGGIFNSGFGGSLEVVRSTLSNNTANNPDEAAGGAIGGAGTMTIFNTTISGNAADAGNGGGIGMTGGTARLNNVTLAFNATSGLGGAFYAEAGAFISISNSLLADNTGGPTNCSGVISLGYNLFTSADCPEAAGDITVPDPLLNPLADNGGPTETHSPQALSPAIDAGHPVPNFTQFDAGNFSQLQTQGYARLDGDTLLLAAGTSEVGSAFVAEPIDVTRDFSAKFEFKIAPGASGAADGFTFTISDDPTVLGDSGGFLGIGRHEPIDDVVLGVVNGVSVEFDTWVNGEAEEANDAVAEDHIGIDFNGSLSSVALDWFGSHGVLSDGNVWTAWVDYDATAHVLEVRASSDGIRPAPAFVSASVDIFTMLDDTVAYVGFTGATGSAGISGEQRILSFSLDTYCETTDQRGAARPKDAGCDIGAYEAQIALELGDVTLRTATVGEGLPDGMSYPGVTDVNIIEIPVEKLAGDSFNTPESAPLGSFPLGSFPIGSFDMRSSPLGSFPLGSFPIGSFPIGSFPLGSFPIGSFPLSSIPLLTEGGWAEILEDIPELAGAPLQTVTFEQLLTHSSFPDSVAGLELRDLSIQGSPLGSFSLPGLSLGATTVEDLDDWASNAGESSRICTTLFNEDPAFADCANDDTLLSLEYKGAPVSALSLSSLPLGSFPIGSFPLGSFPIGSFPLGSFPIGSFPLGSFPIGSFPLGSFPIGSFPLGSFNLLAAPTATLPLGSFPIGSFPLGSFEIEGESFCDFYDDQVTSVDGRTCAVLGVDPGTDTLADLIAKLADSAGNIDISTTPLGSFPMGSFKIGSLPIGSFPIGSFDLAAPPLSELTLAGFDGCQKIDGTPDCSSSPLLSTSTLTDVVDEYGSLAASPLGSFPLGSFNLADMPLGSFPIGSFPLGSFEINGTPLGSFPLGSFDLVSSPLGSFPLGSFTSQAALEAVVDDPTGLCGSCQTLTDAELAGAIKATATLYDLAGSSQFATTTFGEVLDAMSLAMLYGPGTLASIEDTGALTLGQILISMMLKTDFPWETIPLAQLDVQEFSADNFVTYSVAIQLQGTETETFTVEVTLDDSFLYLEDSSALFVIIDGPDDLSFIDDPVILDNEDGTQTLSYTLNLGGFNTSVIGFSAVPSLALGTYAATATVQFGTNDPVVAENSVASVEVIPDPLTDPLGPAAPIPVPPDVLYLGFIDTPSDNDFFAVQGEAGSRVAVFMANPAGDNDLIMYEPATTVEAKGQSTVSAALDSIPFEDDGVNYQGNLEEEPNALEDVNLAAAPLASISTNRDDADEMVSAIAGDNEPFVIQVSGYNGATSEQPYTLRVKVTPEVPNPQCTGRVWPGAATSTVEPAGSWTPNTNAVFLVNGTRLAASDPGGAAAADAALTAINKLIHAPGIIDGVVVDVSTDIDLLAIADVNAIYSTWDGNPCDVDAANDIVNVITQYLEEMRVGSPDLAYVTIVGSDEIIPFARKPDETSIANESTFANEFKNNAMFGALVTRHFLSDDSYGDIDPIPWLDRFLNVPELGVGRLLESAADIQSAAENYIAFGGVLDPQTALSAGYDFIADAAEEIDDTFTRYSPAFGFAVEPALIDQPGIAPNSAWTRSDFLGATGLNTPHPVEQVSFNMHFDFDEALPSSGDAAGTYTENLINTTDLGTTNLAGGIWFTVGCHSGSNLADVSVVGGAPSDDWAQAFSRLGAVYLAQNAYGLGDTEAVALTERLMANFALNLNGSMTIGQAHAYAKQQYFADLGLYGEYDYKALQAATLFGLPMYQYGTGAKVEDPPESPLTVAEDPISHLMSASWSLSDTGITQTMTDSKGELFSVEGEVQFVHYRPLQPIVRRDVTGFEGEVASGAFLTSLATEDQSVEDIAFARPVIALGRIEPEVETDRVVFPTAFTNIANYKAPPPDGGPFAPRQQLNVIVGQFTSPMDGSTRGTERLFHSLEAQVFYRPASSSSAAPMAVAAVPDDFIRPEFDNVQASVVGSGGSQQAAFSVDVSDDGVVLRVAVLYLKSVTETDLDGDSINETVGNWELVDLVQGDGNNWTGGGPVDLSGITDGQIDYMVQAVDGNGNVANSTFKGLFYVAEEILPELAPDIGGDPAPGTIGVELNVDGQPVDPEDQDDWIDSDSVGVEITHDPERTYEYSVDFAPFIPLEDDGKFVITEDGVHIVTVRETNGDGLWTFVVLIDTTAPTVLITTPADGDFIVQGEDTAADYDCLDAGSGIASCVGTVADGYSVPSTSIGSQTFAVTAQDYAHEGDVPSSAVTVQSSYYVVQALDLDGPIDPIAKDDSVEITASLTDLCDFAETVTIDWGDSTEEEIELVDACPGGVNGSHNLVRSHTYSSADVYQINVSVDYGEQFTQVGVIDFVVIYDGSGGFVTGGGWINSPPSAYTPNDPNDPLVTGKAHFGFMSKYKKGQSAPTGSTNFRFAAGDLEFDATSYDWMIISGANARYKGEGTVNGGSDLYKFMVTALDADIAGAGITQDGFRIKIWQEDSSGAAIVLYDNGLGVDDSTGSGGTTPLGGGSIKIHEAKKK